MGVQIITVGKAQERLVEVHLVSHARGGNAPNTAPHRQNLEPIWLVVLVGWFVRWDGLGWVVLVWLGLGWVDLI